MPAGGPSVLRRLVSLRVLVPRVSLLLGLLPLFPRRGLPLGLELLLPRVSLRLARPLFGPRVGVHLGRPRFVPRGTLRLVLLPAVIQLVFPLSQLGLPVSQLSPLLGLKLLLPTVRYCHADDPTEVWPAGSAAVAMGVAGSGTRCRYVHMPLM